jgi:hypothetical protein
MSSLSSCSSANGNLSSYVVNELINATKNIESTCGSTTITTPLIVEGLLSVNDGIVINGGMTTDYIATTGNVVAGGLITGTTGVVGTLQTASQPNITNVGTLSNIDTSGNITAVGNITSTGSLTSSFITTNNWRVTTGGNSTQSGACTAIDEFRTGPYCMAMYAAAGQVISPAAWTNVLFNAGFFGEDNVTVFATPNWTNANMKIQYSPNGRFLNTDTKTKYWQVDAMVICSTSTAVGWYVMHRITVFNSAGVAQREKAHQFSKAYNDGTITETWPKFYSVSGRVMVPSNGYVCIQVYFGSLAGTWTLGSSVGTTEITNCSITNM